MAKEVLRDPKVINLVTESLVKTTDDYFIGNCEWKDGTCSDMVLEPKNALSDLPPLIVEIQHTVSRAFMKRAVGYCLQAFARYRKDPIMLIICVEKLNQDNVHVELSKLPGVFSYFSEPWTEHCYIISKESIKDNLSIPLHPLVALGSFFTNRSLSLADHPFKNDPTVQYLYTSAILQHQISVINKDIPLSFMDFQLMEYNKLLTLAHSLNQPQLGEAVNDAKTRTLTMKRGYEELFATESSLNKKIKTSVPPPPTTSTPTTAADRNDSKYENAMKFVTEFKQKKEEKELTMDWVACWKEGKDLDIFNYKNSESLRQQFIKYTKRKSKQTNSDNSN
ncbi:uncharacterized protein EV154DRAFT_522240 [Mucor mucedo]|uniref:uncharacterized protein n=1 Tax=Mucor mucedo TaxID=29922 RepID=UPI00221E4516|nr:uncharacterized protein EV154DRAFT_522240 [Mucor mucedo]KAI7884470.1 hypothetical protein EV154DRAFT_522240 [Mucor mucedo]